MNKSVLACISATCIAMTPGLAWSQTLLSRFEFNGNLLNEVASAPDGTFKVGDSPDTSTNGTATYITGPDGTANSAITFNGINEWIDATVNGFPNNSSGAIAEFPDDPAFVPGPGVVSGTVMAWVKSTKTTAQYFMGNLNFIDSQAFQAGWSGSRLEAFPRAANSSVSRFIVGDPTGTTDWADGAWHHVAFQWNGDLEQGSGEPFFAGVYLDGERLGAASTNFFLNEPDFQSPWESVMAIGARNNRNLGTGERFLADFWQGGLDDLRVYDDALSDGQIEAIFLEKVPTLAADFNKDERVDGDDFLIWQQAFPTASGATSNTGDANGDGVVDGDDFLIWQTEFGSGTGQAGSAVPEPGSYVLLFAMLATLVRSRRRN